MSGVPGIALGPLRLCFGKLRTIALVQHLLSWSIFVWELFSCPLVIWRNIGWEKNAFKNTILHWTPWMSHICWKRSSALLFIGCHYFVWCALKWSKPAILLHIWEFFINSTRSKHNEYLVTGCFALSLSRSIKVKKARTKENRRNPPCSGAFGLVWWFKQKYMLVLIWKITWRRFTCESLVWVAFVLSKEKRFPTPVSPGASP